MASIRTETIVTHELTITEAEALEKLGLEPCADCIDILHAVRALHPSLEGAQYNNQESDPDNLLTITMPDATAAALIKLGIKFGISNV